MQLPHVFSLVSYLKVMAGTAVDNLLSKWNKLFKEANNKDSRAESWK